MTKTLEQTTFFKNTTPERLYEIYMSPKEHGKMIRAKVSIKNEEGMRFKAHDGWIIGKNLQLIPGKLIVQSWRGKDWRKNEMDSTLILKFCKVKGGAEISMVHANVPERYAKDIDQGWDQYYWKNMKEYVQITSFHI